jgi:hypothetical protein
MNFNIPRALAGADSWNDLGMVLRSARKTRAWFDQGMPVPPPQPVKVRNILAIADIFGLNVLVETGTQAGATLAATLHRFEYLYSIEIFEPFVVAARARFAAHPKVTIVHGDSATALPAVLAAIDEPILFWLDGHYSGEGTGKGEVESPIVAEIATILKMRPPGRDAIIIDDARCFGGRNGYPALDKFLGDLKQSFGVEPRHADDAIFIMPR